MRTKDVKVPGVYLVKVSGHLSHVGLVRANPLGGWDGINLPTGRAVRIKTASRLRKAVIDGK